MTRKPETMLSMQCTNNPFERAIDVCDECGLPFSREFLVFPLGDRRPPFCKACAIAMSGVRHAARRPRMPKKEVRRRREEVHAALCRRSTDVVGSCARDPRPSDDRRRRAQRRRVPAHPANARSSGASDAAARRQSPSGLAAMSRRTTTPGQCSASTARRRALAPQRRSEASRGHRKHPSSRSREPTLASLATPAQ